MNRKLHMLTVVSALVALCVGAHFGWVDPHAVGFVFFGMAFPADAIDNVDLKALTAGGVVSEDVLKKIFMLSEVNTPFQDLIGTDVCNQDYTEWVQDDLGSPSLTKFRVSGSDASAYEAVTGSRVGNRTQINARTIAVSERARNSSVIGQGDVFTFQTMRAMQRVRQDVEAHVTSPQASVVDDNNATAGKAGGFPAWLTSNASVGAGAGANGGFNTGTKLVVAPTAGTARVLAWSRVTALVLSIFKKFGNPTTLMTTPDLVAGINTFLNSAAAAGIRANPVANVNGAGGAEAKQTAQGYFQVIVTAFGFALTIVPNRMQQAYGGSVDLLLIDPTRVAMAYLDGYKVKPLGKNGLSDRADVTTDWTVKVYNEAAHGVDRDLLPAGTVTA